MAAAAASQPLASNQHCQELHFDLRERIELPAPLFFCSGSLQLPLSHAHINMCIHTHICTSPCTFTSVGRSEASQLHWTSTIAVPVGLSFRPRQMVLSNGYVSNNTVWGLNSPKSNLTHQDAQLKFVFLLQCVNYSPIFARATLTRCKYTVITKESTEECDQPAMVAWKILFIYHK